MRCVAAPATASTPSRGATPPVAARTRAARSGPSTSTASPPSASNSSTISGRRTMLTVRTPARRASRIRYRPQLALAAFCTNQSPGCSAAKSSSSTAAVGPLTVNSASCAASPSGAGRQSAPRQRSRSRKVPLPSGGNTRSPGAKPASRPARSTRPMPSKPGVRGNGLRKVAEPSMVRRSAMCIAAASMRTTTSPSAGSPGSCSTTRSTSRGAP